ncbi:Arabinose 5-phosphate isomerase KpsF [Stieleria varia]|uniref:Arabinose 5-phosphate isomerase KpsF n=2 Tax=Stieleria varia TaxID=2528005 RepID=A0A5C6AT11_9BACT|nr:Arabinose 5-phosphate isomerase KpsF [Stieleria varia]
MLRETVTAEANAIAAAAKLLTADAVQAAEMTAQCDGCVVVTGVGKAGLVGQKLVATLASTGTPAHFLHPAEAVHGDLGRVRENDLVWAISNSGRSEEITRIASILRHQSSGLIAITADKENPLAAAADCVVTIGHHSECCPNGLAPTASTAVMMAVGDAIAMLVSQLKQFTPQDFAKFHPGGSLGRKLATVQQYMRPLSACRVASETATIRQAIVTRSDCGRRSGAVMLINDSGQLSGIFTDSDLARLFETGDDSATDTPIASKMTSRPHSIATGVLLNDAIARMSRHRISELPVVDTDHKPVGMLDITDLIALGEVDDTFRASVPLTRPRLSVSHATPNSSSQ